MRQGIVDITANCSCITAIQTSVIFPDSISLSKELCACGMKVGFGRANLERAKCTCCTQTFSRSHIYLFIFASIKSLLQNIQRRFVYNVCRILSQRTKGCELWRGTFAFLRALGERAGRFLFPTYTHMCV
jgi:hypothetical protein